jgi:hypothetical protein
MHAFFETSGHIFELLKPICQEKELRSVLEFGCGAGWNLLDFHKDGGMYYGENGQEHKGKLEIAEQICKKYGFLLEEVAYIGDDINCKELLESVGLCACPNNSQDQIKTIPNIIQLSKNGGYGAVREFVNIILNC